MTNKYQKIWSGVPRIKALQSVKRVLIVLSVLSFASIISDCYSVYDRYQIRSNANNQADLLLARKQISQVFLKSLLENRSLTPAEKSEIIRLAPIASYELEVQK